MAAVAIFAAVILALFAASSVLALRPRLVLSGVGMVRNPAFITRRAIARMAGVFGMTINNPGTDGKSGGPIDTDLTFSDDVDLSASASSTVLDLGENFAPVPYQVANVLIDVTAIKTSAGTETYHAKVWESADQQSWTETGVYITLEAIGQISKPVGLTKRYVKIGWQLSEGDSPAITGTAVLTPKM